MNLSTPYLFPLSLSGWTWTVCLYLCVSLFPLFNLVKDECRLLLCTFSVPSPSELSFNISWSLIRTYLHIIFITDIRRIICILSLQRTGLIFDSTFPLFHLWPGGFILIMLHYWKIRFVIEVLALISHFFIFSDRCCDLQWNHCWIWRSLCR